ncbi:MAG: hypothetical protein ACTSWD_04875 [Candidatus Heimdallarchaeota archaeon]
MASFDQAVKWMKEGKKVVKKSTKEVYFYEGFKFYRGNKIPVYSVRTGFDNNDWEVWKKKVICQHMDCDKEATVIIGCALCAEHFNELLEATRKLPLMAQKEKSLSDDIFEFPKSIKYYKTTIPSIGTGGKPTETSSFKISDENIEVVIVEKVKKAVERLKFEMHLTLANAEIINKVFGEKLCSK